jgi:hypothetical protein
VVLVYTVSNDSIARAFAAETGREQSGNRVQGMLQFIPSSSGKGFDILTSPGRATGWTQRSYPFRQEQPGSGDIEPLLLPWGGISKVIYHWDGSTFSQ